MRLRLLPWAIQPRMAPTKGTLPCPSRPQPKMVFSKDVWLDCVAAGAWIVVSDDNAKTMDHTLL
ncbi:hypothetical protein ACS0TY_032353 [Phlomoides rotata]